MVIRYSSGHVSKGNVSLLREREREREWRRIDESKGGLLKWEGLLAGHDAHTDTHKTQHVEGRE